MTTKRKKDGGEITAAAPGVVGRDRWEFLCNGGPNGRTVGGTAPSLGKAIGRLEPMMKALCATIGQVQRADTIDHEGEFEGADE